MSDPQKISSRPVSRRTLLRAAAAAGAILPAGAIGTQVLASSRPAGALPEELLRPPICHASFAAPVVLGQKRALKLTWNAGAVCTVGVPVAAERGLFAKHNLDVELVNFGGSTDQLLEAIATGKADAGVGMALRWLKPLEQGFDVKITTAIHGGCMRLFSNKAVGLTRLTDLKGKTVGVSDLGAPDKNFFSIVLQKLGIDPNSDVTWRVFPADLLPVALQKGEVQAFSLGDPLGWIARERDGLVEIANNLDGEYAHRACCVMGVRGSLVRQDRPVAAALTQAVLEAQEIVSADPDGAAQIFAKYSTAKPEQLAAMLRSHTHNHHPAGADLKTEIALYAEELKLVSVMKPRTDTAKFADRVFADVLS
jgi:NitT/TauT family transport system substrate-binding protein